MTIPMQFTKSNNFIRRILQLVGKQGLMEEVQPLVLEEIQFECQQISSPVALVAFTIYEGSMAEQF